MFSQSHTRLLTYFITFFFADCSFIVIASSNEYARKILNSPTYAEPCLVASAKKVLCPDNWYVPIA